MTRRQEPTTATTGRRWLDQSGQATVLLVVVVVVALGAAVLVARLGALVHDRAAARATADAAALAGVTAGDAAVARVAEANGGVVLEVRRQGSEVEVRVRVGDAEATSRAGPGG